MQTDLLLLALDEELDRLRLARNLLAGQPQAPVWRSQIGTSADPAARRKRNLSDEARQKIVAAQKRRWAAAKAEAPPLPG